MIQGDLQMFFRGKQFLGDVPLKNVFFTENLFSQQIHIVILITVKNRDKMLMHLFGRAFGNTGIGPE